MVGKICYFFRLFMPDFTFKYIHLEMVKLINAINKMITHINIEIFLLYNLAIIATDISITENISGIPNRSWISDGSFSLFILSSNIIT